MPGTPKVGKRYFAQVGAELIEVPADHYALIADGALFQTSSPPLFYQVRAQVGDETVVGIGPTWEAAEADLNGKLPREGVK